MSSPLEQRLNNLFNTYLGAPDPYSRGFDTTNYDSAIVKWYDDRLSSNPNNISICSEM